MVDNRYSLAALQLFKDKYVEINTGEVRTTLLFSDSEHDQKSVIRGVLVDVIGDGIVIECKMRKGIKKVLLNAWSVVTIIEIDDIGLTKDVYVDEEGRRR